ncbi:MutS-related protein [Desulfolucanica intricata]|uniref:MutS-related protein n=1 Tax=Desulfolucanica intricata TaxID=1285191 RepID=UPI000830E872|nr:MutS family DNA mismatch repair protein [Desulfolucanica intricata]
MKSNLYKKYEKLKNDYEKKVVKKKKQSDFLVFLRSLIFLSIVGFLLAYTFFLANPIYLFLSGILIVVFFLLIVKHNRIKESVKYLEKLCQINDTALQRLSGKWANFSNTGNRFLNPEHPYSSDLNIFGQGSLFQYINAATFYIGEEKLAKLLSSSDDLDQIHQRQQAVAELKPRLNWRQHFQALGMLDDLKQIKNTEKLLTWAESKPLLINNKYLSLIRFFPFITFGLVVLGLFHLTPLYLWILPLAIQIIIVAFTEKTVHQAFSETGKTVKEIKRYSALLNCIEPENFEAPLLVKLKDKLVADGYTPSQQIKNLFKIAERMALRYSSLHIIINISTLWDLHTLIKLESWKNKSGQKLRTWLSVIGEFEALSSLAGLAHDHPDWAFPEITKSSPTFSASSLGHPLIKDETRVCNNISLPGPGTILLITGSNMSGKSTFLRTIGINLVLAYAGAPVCAKKLCCSLMDIYSSMQVSDNLEQNVSTFYAELKRIKLIVDAAKTGKPIIFLIDEIFNGTNSKDRILGAQAVIKNLNKLNTIGLVSTHDLELSRLETESPLIKNYHFRDEITGERINFDYRLRPGVSQSTNAMALMKIIGLLETE